MAEGKFDSDYKNMVDNAISQGAWTVFTVHDVGANTSLPLNEMNLLIDYLDANRSSIWIAPFGTVSSYWRAQKTIEKLTPNATPTGTSYTWDVPAYYPDNVNLKVKVKNGDGYQLVQNGQAIQPDADGNYTISFGAKSLELKRKPYAVNYSNSNNLTVSMTLQLFPDSGVASRNMSTQEAAGTELFIDDWAALVSA